MVKKFWQIMGGTYLFFFKRKKVILGLIFTILILGQILMSVWLVVSQFQIKADMKKNQDSITKLLNKTYSQAWQLNTKLTPKAVAPVAPKKSNPQ